jgi:ATP-binding cassette subfamily C protein LapB
MSPASDQPPSHKTAQAAPIALDAASDDPLLGCLAILAVRLGTPVGLETLRAGLPLHGGPAGPAMLVRAAVRAGFAARVARRRHVGEISPLNLPCILLLENGGACVLDRIDAQAARILLPESGGGETSLPLAELQARFAGSVIFMRPRPDADRRRHGEPSRAPRDVWFWGALVELWPIYGHVLVAATAINLLGLAGSIYAMNVYDRVIPNNATETLWVLTIGVLLVYVFDFLLRSARAYFVDVAGKGADAVIAARLMEQLLALRLEVRPASTGALASNLREYEALREFFASATLATLIDLPFVAIFVLAAWLIAGPVAWIALAAVPVVLLLGLALQLPLARAVERNQAESARKHAILVEAIDGLETLKVARAEGRTQLLWERFVEAAARSAMASRVMSMLAVNLTGLAIAVAGAAVIFVGVHEIAAGRLTMGALIAATILTSRAMAPLGQVAALAVRLNQSVVALRALDRLMAAPRERDVEARYVSRPSLQGAIELRDISFAYPVAAASAGPDAPGRDGATPAIAGLTIAIAAGERVGIIGRVGSGKTTFARLVSGLYQPNQGAVLVDGTDIRQIDPAELRRQIGYVPQDAHLVAGSVKENLLLGMPDAGDDAMLRAATIAGVDDFIRSRPQGYDTEVGERGQRLSGGQRAAVTIARALIADPPILLLDEPTGAMDTTSEQRFKTRLQEVLPGRTLVLVTHRGSMLSLVDRLVVLDHGRVVADGPKEKVLEELQLGAVRGTGRSGA